METRITTRHFRCDAHPGISLAEPDRRLGRRRCKGSAYNKQKTAKCVTCHRRFYTDAMVGGRLCLECSIQQGAK